MADQKGNKGRIQYWDIAKGITILLVVFGHINCIDPYIRSLIFAYHMPFFFIANAYFIKNYNLHEHFIKSVRSLMIPYSVVCVLSAILCVNQNRGEVPNYRIFLNRIADMFIGMSKISNHFIRFESVWLVWFVICLFASRMIYVMLMNKLEAAPVWLSFLIMAVLAGVGEAVGLLYAFLPWSLDVALVALPFMWIGDQLHKTDWISKNAKRIWIWGFVFLIWLFLARKGAAIEMATRSYPGYVICFVEAMAGVLVCIKCSLLIETLSKRLSAFFAWCGKNSMIILALHCLEMRFLDWNTVIYSRLPFAVNENLGFIIKMSCILIITWMTTQSQRGLYLLNLTDCVN